MIEELKGYITVNAEGGGYCLVNPTKIRNLQRGDEGVDVLGRPCFEYTYEYDKFPRRRITYSIVAQGMSFEQEIERALKEQQEPGWVPIDG